ncbi:glycoside hydrolase family 97 protein [Sphingobium sp. B2]|uniref:glycoside hydrolase family 97 protein n=1 Tax=Sphingobium sp. B2 TaxID=2583228 RepID=UPI0011A00F7B|nr:glycoside hydrolase family 97 protein [Sphingobium sp. B2]
MIPLLLAAAAPVAILSPDHSIAISVSPDGKSYSVTRKGEMIVKDAPLGLDIANEPDFGPLTLVDVAKQRVDRTIPLVATKASEARDHYNGAVIRFRERAAGGRTLSIEARAYNEGVAFRYVLPGGKPVEIAGEETGFRLVGDPQCEVSELTGSHERPWQLKAVSALDRSKLYDLPMLCASASGKTHFALTQAGIGGYAGFALKPVAGGLDVRLFPRKGRPYVAVQSPDGLHSAWRVIMAGDRAGDLIASPIVGNLSQQASGDFSWVKPGKAAWDWWSGPMETPPPTMDRYRHFIDFAAQSGFPYFLIDAGWAYKTGQCCDLWPHPENDITRAEAGIDIPALVQYARGKGVDLLLWVHWLPLDARLDEALDLYQRWGIKGIKVDFMDRDDQEMVDFYVRVAEATAKRHMLLDMHGAFPPSGLQRTYPNYITQEGVMGAEHDKFAWGRVNPAHNVRLAYTRMLLGPMDYTPGGFRNGATAPGPRDGSMPTSQHSRGQALAMYVVYDSPLQMVSDAPEAYVNASGFDFIKQVPTAWDETRFIEGTPESHIVLARRKGRDWYIGAMTNGTARRVDIPLSLLGSGRFEATVWQDGASPNMVDRTTRQVTSGDTLSVQMSAGGGAAIHIRPVS